MSGMEAVAIVGCVAAVVSAFQHGDALVKKLKDTRAARKQSLPPEQLERSLAQGAPAVMQGWNYGNDRYGVRFGDSLYDLTLSFERC